MLFPLACHRRSSFTAFSRGWLPFRPWREPESLRSPRARDHACYRATCGYSVILPNLCGQYQDTVSPIGKCNCEMKVYTVVYRRISQTQTSTARTAKHNAKWHRRGSHGVGDLVNRKATVSLSINVRERRKVLRRGIERMTKKGTDATLYRVVPTQTGGSKHNRTNHADPHS